MEQIFMETGLKRLNITYQAKSPRVLYDICDLNGKILKTGGCNKTELNGGLLINTEGMAKGSYFLYIIDGAETSKRKISI